MINRSERAGLQVATNLVDLVEHKVLPGTGRDADAFWSSFADILADLAPKNQKLLAKRQDLQQKITEWHAERIGQPHDGAAYHAFLTEIGYLAPEGPAFKIDTQNVDPEIASIAGPQLVVPVMNARFALNAANARWGSLYDALYGTDVIGTDGGADQTADYNPVRGGRVVAYAAAVLDIIAPLNEGSHRDAVKYDIENGQLVVSIDGRETRLSDPEQFVGFTKTGGELNGILLRRNGLHAEIQLDDAHPIGREHPAGVKDVVMESALTTIQDCEDSIAAVDAEDKVAVYSNWLHLMLGDLSTRIEKAGKSFDRVLNADRVYTTPEGAPLVLPGRALMLIRTVGHLMTNDAILDRNGNAVPEGIMDTMITGAIALHDLKKLGKYTNSRTGSMYVVKPKMHGPEEVAFANALFDRVEDALGMARHTMKIGVMDEERRTTLNLTECIRAVKDRIVFINTGFLDRTGDEIHTSMAAGPVVRKEAMKAQPWISAYENWNVDKGLRAGFRGRAQIGKGMWPKPDEMAEMMEIKIGHPESGANCAWVPSPTAATLHSLHYHRCHVAQRQEQILHRTGANIDDILTIPLLHEQNLSDADVKAELDNNAQGILGYVVRWIEQGIGCSKVPDINNVGLMEDRATLRISSQHMANWLKHGICTEDQIMDTMKRMAAIVDQQNAHDANYTNMAPDFTHSIAFQAACDLVFAGESQPNGYTEPILHARRREYKAKLTG